MEQASGVRVGWRGRSTGRKAIAVVAVLLVGGSACAPSGPGAPVAPREVPDPATLADVQGDRPEPGAAPTRSDLVYVPGGLTGCPTGSDVDCIGTFDGHAYAGSQTLDVYEPPGGATAARPVIVWIHGGFSIGGDKRDVGGEHYPANLLARQLARGYVVVSLNYRLNLTTNGPNGVIVPTTPVAAEDLDVAIRFLKANASTLGIDPTRIVLWGHSWGAWAATLQATAPGRHTPSWLPADLAGFGSGVAGVIAEAGPTDLALTVPHALAELERTGDQGPIDLDALDLPQLRDDSPWRYVDDSDAPIYAIVGADDPLIPLADANAMADRYAAIGRPDLYCLDIVDRTSTAALPAAWRTHVPHPGANRAELEHFLDRGSLDRRGLDRGGLDEVTT